MLWRLLLPLPGDAHLGAGFFRVLPPFGGPANLCRPGSCLGCRVPRQQDCPDCSGPFRAHFAALPGGTHSGPDFVAVFPSGVGGSDLSDVLGGLRTEWSPLPLGADLGAGFCARLGAEWAAGHGKRVAAAPMAGRMKPIYPVLFLDQKAVCRNLFQNLPAEAVAAVLHPGSLQRLGVMNAQPELVAVLRPSTADVARRTDIDASADGVADHINPGDDMAHGCGDAGRCDASLNLSRSSPAQNRAIRFELSL